MQLTLSRDKIFRSRVFGLAAMVLGVAAWWYNQHQASTQGEFSIKLCLFVPLGLAGGLLILVRAEWAQPWRPDSTRGHKAAVIAVFSFMMVASGVELFRLRHEILDGAPQQKVIPWTPDMGRPVIPASLSRPAVPLAITFLGREYRPGSFNERHNATWEFVTGGETLENWTTLLTVVDRPDARTREDLDRLAEGILKAYRSRGAQILAPSPWPRTRRPFSITSWLRSMSAPNNGMNWTS